METKYLEIIPKAVLTSQERADEINAELYEIANPYILPKFEQPQKQTAWRELA